VTPPIPLHYAACTDTAQRIDARVRWTECGKDPEVRFVADCPVNESN
jgi:hypothetical protein